MFDEWKAIQPYVGGCGLLNQYSPTASQIQLPMERLKQKKEAIMNTITENQKELELIEQAIVALEASPVVETILNLLVRSRIL